MEDKIELNKIVQVCFPGTKFITPIINPRDYEDTTPNNSEDAKWIEEEEEEQQQQQQQPFLKIWVRLKFWSRHIFFIICW